jgi:hypothetical protein
MREFRIPWQHPGQLAFSPTEAWLGLGGRMMTGLGIGSLSTPDEFIQVGLTIENAAPNLKESWRIWRYPPPPLHPDNGIGDAMLGKIGDCVGGG